ncbi:DUF1161 domain-containing protein [Enterobacter cloacae subsp. cloacae]|nr:DUF1161 domain-containing protein [Enterobacter cloacae subsp. cloacae]
MQQKINNGVLNLAFTLNIVIQRSADRPDAQVVGHCAMILSKFVHYAQAAGAAAGAQESLQGELQ